MEKKKKLRWTSPSNICYKNNLRHILQVSQLSEFRVINHKQRSKGKNSLMLTRQILMHKTPAIMKRAKYDTCNDSPMY